MSISFTKTLLEPIFWGKNYHHYQYLSTVYVCERTEILGDINNVQSQVMEYLDNCGEQKYTGVPDKTFTLTKS